MIRRVKRITVKAVGTQHIDLPWSGTFHAIGARLLREYAPQIGLKPSFTILDRSDAAENGKPYIAFEDGFLRSIRPGTGARPLSFILDRSGIYYDAREPCDLGHRRQTSPSCRPDLAGGEHPSPALIELRTDGFPSLPNRLRVDHADPHTAAAPSQESRRPESNHHMAHKPNPIHLL